MNSSRGNHPYAEIQDEDTDIWYRNDYSQNNIPTEFINEYAEKYNPPNQSDERFEPREEQKGNTARAMVYFYTMYNDVADNNFWELQKETLFNLSQKKPIIPSDLEIKENPPSRSAKLRYAIKKSDFFNFETDIEAKFKNFLEIEKFGDKL